MNDYTIYSGPRRTGKTTWLFEQAIEALWAGPGDVAIVVHDEQRKQHLTRKDFPGLVGVDFYTERSFPSARGKIYDHIFVDEANLFHDSPVELCRHVSPGVPATFTYTPDPFGG